MVSHFIPMLRPWWQSVLLILLTAVAGTLITVPALGQMVDPAIDRPHEPFSYYAKPTDVLGVMDGQAATLVTPEGYLYTGFGELMFFTGDPPHPVQQRVKTLLGGFLPVIRYSFSEGGVGYEFTMFAATLDGNPESPLMNFVRVQVRNERSTRATAFVSVAVRYRNQVNSTYGAGDNRFRRPTVARRLGEYAQPGVAFDPNWSYGFDSGAALRDGRVLYLFSPSPALRRLTLKEGYNEAPGATARKLGIAPDTPADVVQYKLPLAAGESATIEIKYPYEPILAGSALVNRLRAANFDEYLLRTVRFWKDLLARGIDISVPEDKVVNSFKANLIYPLIARDKHGAIYVQTVNKFQYHAFWLRDASYIARMYDLSGYSEYARQVLDFFAGWQQPDGNFVSQGGQFDGWGQTLWAYGRHYRITQDRAFAEGVLPAIRRAVDWLHQARRSDPLALMPVTTPGDNENLSGHVTGHNFWALAGLKDAISMARSLGDEGDASAWQREYDDYYAALVRRLLQVTANTGGYIPPGLDGEHGQDWGNMLAVYPETILDPHHPMVTATLQATRGKYQEGIMTYGDGRWLHHYLTMKNTETEVIRGDQQIAIEELYALLVHTSSTHAGFEFAILPWSTRDFGANLAPHGWFAAKFRALLRNMMVREQGNDLHLLSCISPEWVKPGRSISVQRAPSDFGQVNFHMSFPSPSSALLTLDNHFGTPPGHLVLHLPWFASVASIQADGHRLNPSSGAVQLPLMAKRIAIQWILQQDSPPLSYDKTVSDYKTEYRRRYERFLQTGDNSGK
jgi:hypothetical protein